MASRRLSLRSMDLARVWLSTTPQRVTTHLHRSTPVSIGIRPFTNRSFLSASPSPAPNPMAATETGDPKAQPPPSVHESQDPDSDSARLSSYLGEADSNDAHDANREAYGAPDPSLDASNSAYLGEADSDDGWEAQRDREGRVEEPVDASQSAYLGEADSDDGFEGRRAAHPEEGDHGITDASVSGDHGQSGEGDGEIEQTRS